MSQHPCLGHPSSFLWQCLYHPLPRSGPLSYCLPAALVLQCPHCCAIPEPAAIAVPKDAACSLCPAPSGLTSQSSCALFQIKFTPYLVLTPNLVLFLLHPRKIVAWRSLRRHGFTGGSSRRKGESQVTPMPTPESCHDVDRANRPISARALHFSVWVLLAKFCLTFWKFIELCSCGSVHFSLCQHRAIKKKTFA